MQDSYEQNGTGHQERKDQFAQHADLAPEAAHLPWSWLTEYNTSKNNRIPVQLTSTDISLHTLERVTCTRTRKSQNDHCRSTGFGFHCMTVSWRKRQWYLHSSIWNIPNHDRTCFRQQPKSWNKRGWNKKQYWTCWHPTWNVHSYAKPPEPQQTSDEIHTSWTSSFNWTQSIHHTHQEQQSVFIVSSHHTCQWNFVWNAWNQDQCLQPNNKNDKENDTKHPSW